MIDTTITHRSTPPGSGAPNTPEQQQAARLYVCGRLAAADARTILDALGLLPNRKEASE
jgi:hypothetical protein